MRIFVTGGSGFIGGAVIRGLGDRHQIRAMARSEEAARLVAGLGADPVRCSLQDVDGAHLGGAEVVVHCAAHVAEWGPFERYRTENVEGTRRVLLAAKEAGVRRVVHMSTESVLFRGDHLRDMDESWPYPRFTPFPYSATKGEAERLALSTDGDGFEVVVLRPVLVWGPGDRAVLPELVAMASRDKFAWLDRGRHRISPTHVENLVHAVELALDRGRGGEVYFVTDGEKLVLRDFLTRYVATAGITLPDRSVPGWLARGAAAVIEPLWRLLRPDAKPPLTRFGTALLSRGITVTSDKAARELGYRPVLSTEEGLRRLRSAAGAE